MEEEIEVTIPGIGYLVQSHHDEAERDPEKVRIRQSRSWPMALVTGTST